MTRLRGPRRPTARLCWASAVTYARNRGELTRELSEQRREEGAEEETRWAASTKYGEDNVALETNGICSSDDRHSIGQ